MPTRRASCAAPGRSSRSPAVRRATSAARSSCTPTGSRNRCAWPSTRPIGAGRSRRPTTATTASSRSRSSRGSATSTTGCARPPSGPARMAPGVGGEGRELTELTGEQVEKRVGQLEAEMRNAAKNLEYERAAALRDEIQGIRLRVLEEDASVVVARAAEAAATRAVVKEVRVVPAAGGPLAPDEGTAADWRPGRRGGDEG